MTTDNFCFYLQNRLIQTSQTGGQWYSDIPPLVFPGLTQDRALRDRRFVTLSKGESKGRVGRAGARKGGAMGVTNILGNL
jgi:hypothetical protein